MFLLFDCRWFRSFSKHATRPASCVNDASNGLRQFLIQISINLINIFYLRF